MTKITRTFLYLVASAAFFLLPMSTLATNIADTQTKFPLALTIINVCTLEPVDLSGEIHIHSHAALNNDGSTSYATDVNYSDARAVGETTGDAYVFGSNAHS